MTSTELRKRFLDFFEKRGHTVLPSASLIPKDDPSVLFTTAGMQQFKPYYTGQKNAEADFGAQNVATVQKCVRTGDIEEVGDDTHLTFFEMLGNFSFGGYWKKEAITYAYEFITKELGLAIDYVSIFKDDESGIPADEESRAIWQSIDSNLVIREHNKEDNFWGPTGDEGPCGPTTEIYIDGVEVWNIVFNEYYKTKDGTFIPLETKGIDTGMGLERLLVQAVGVSNVYETDLFSSVIDLIKENSKNFNEHSARIIADHIRTCLLLLGDGVTPSNKDRGYILRRLIRRAVRYSDILGLNFGGTETTLRFIARLFIRVYKDTYKEVETKLETYLAAEESKFRLTLQQGLKEFEKGTDPFILATTYGFPIELTEELAKEKGIAINREKFETEMKAHQDASRTGAEQKFKGGLANTSEQTTKLHTAHHLLLAALQRVLGKDVKQRGSNITEERLRLDFSFDRKMTDEEKSAVEKLVNEWIVADYNVVKREMPLAEAEKIGAEMEFGAKYPEIVSVYFICPSADGEGSAISAEFCGGPHVERTGILGTFKILKEEASSQGIRRIKAVLQ